MNIDSEGRLRITPPELFELAASDPKRLISTALITGTPIAFPTYDSYCRFLDYFSARLGIHPRNLFLRGSCKIGFSIAPRPKVWTEMSSRSDLDLAIVDADLFERVHQEVIRWEKFNPSEEIEQRFARREAGRRQDRQFFCYRDDNLPPPICVHLRDTLSSTPTEEFCDCQRRVSAFVYRDWWALQRRYELDLRKLVEGVGRRELQTPPDEPFPSGPSHS